MNGDELLDIKEVKHIFNSIHMECSDTYLREIFAKYDQNNNGSIEPDEFEALVNDLYSKDEIKFLYDRYCSNKDEEAKKSDRLMTSRTSSWLKMGKK
jgi:Ca2+-binding EF-hand superfamily protein